MASGTPSFSREIAPFYDPSATIPHPVLPVIIAQTEIGTQHPRKLLALEEIGPKSTIGPDHHKRPNVRFQGHSRATTPDPRGRSASVPPRATTPRGRSVSVPLSKADSTSSPGSASGSDFDDDHLIAKPEGEAGRPGRGGYTLEKVLGWKPKEYRRIKKFVKQAVEEHLDPAKKFSSQSLDSVHNVQALVVDEFPALMEYVDWWPALDLIHLELHYTCGRAHLDEQKQDAAIGKAIKRQKRTIK